MSCKPRSHSYIAEASSSISLHVRPGWSHVTCAQKKLLKFAALSCCMPTTPCGAQEMLWPLALFFRLQEKVSGEKSVAAGSMLHLSQEQARSNETERLAKQGNQGCLSYIVILYRSILASVRKRSLSGMASMYTTSACQYPAA